MCVSHTVVLLWCKVAHLCISNISVWTSAISPHSHFFMFHLMWIQFSHLCTAVLCTWIIRPLNQSNTLWNVMGFGGNISNSTHNTDAGWRHMLDKFVYYRYDLFCSVSKKPGCVCFVSLMWSTTGPWACCSFAYHCGCRGTLRRATRSVINFIPILSFFFPFSHWALLCFFYSTIV